MATERPDAPAATVEEKPQAEALIEGAIRMAESDIERTQQRLIVVIEEEKVAHGNVEYWKDELNQLVAKRRDLEASLRKLRG